MIVRPIERCSAVVARSLMNAGPLKHGQYTDSKAKKGLAVSANPLIFWLRGLDLNRRPLGYELL
jgi:hypothetical protein